jgi:hypothetical protein
MKKLLLLLFLFSNMCFAESKLDLMAGFYAISATNNGTNYSLSGLGAYSIAYRQTIRSNLEVGLSYNVAFSNIVSGDKNYGPSVFMNYFPMSLAQQVNVTKDGLTFIKREKIRPYLGFNFSQKQYQSAQTSIGGLGLQLGTEYLIKNDTYLKLELQYNPMSGNKKISATETNLLVGVSFGF